VNDTKTLPSLIANPAFQNRIQRGDTQILGRQAVALQATYTFNESWSGTFEVLQSLTDSSGILAPSVSWDISDRMRLQGAVYYGYGASSIAGVPQSQFGTIPPTIIVRVSFYD
jgi:hypothetical protein